MTEWGVVGVIIALVGFIATIIKPMINLTQSITKLTVLVEKLCKDMDEEVAHRRESHQRIWEHNEKQDEMLSDHESRIHILEQKS